MPLGRSKRVEYFDPYEEVDVEEYCQDNQLLTDRDVNLIRTFKLSMISGLVALIIGVLGIVLISAGIPAGVFLVIFTINISVALIIVVSVVRHSIPSYAKGRGARRVVYPVARKGPYGS